MTSIILLKFFHYLGCFLQAGWGCRRYLAKNHQKRYETCRTGSGQRQMLAGIGLAAIILLWGTGIALTYLVYASFDLGWAFHLKLLGQAFAACLCLKHPFKPFDKAGKPPNPPL